MTQLSGELYLTVGQSRLALGALLSLAQNRMLADDFKTIEAAIPNTAELIELARREGVVNHPLDSADDYLQTLSTLGLNSRTATAFEPAVRRWLAESGQQSASDLLDGALE